MAVIDMSGGAGTLNLAGNFSASNATPNFGTLTSSTTSTFVYNGTGAQTVAGTATIVYNHLTINKASGTATLAANTTVGGDLSVSAGTLDLSTFTANRTGAGGTLTVAAGATMKIGGTNIMPTNYSTHSFATTSTVEYSGAAQTVAASETYGHLTLSGSGTKTQAATATTATVKGNFTNNGVTFAGNGGTVTLSGGTAQTIGGTSGTTFNNLTIANTSGGVSLGGSVSQTVGSTLTLTSGVVTTGSNTLFVNNTSNSAISGGSGTSYVNGNLQKAFTTGSGQSFTFPIGDASTYTPINLANMTVGTAGNLTANTTAGQHASIGTSGINSSKDVNRYWTLTAGTFAASPYDSTFNFVSGDVIGGASTSAFVIKRFSGGSWSSTTTGTLTSTSSQATGLSAVGDFAVGEAVATPTPTHTPTPTITPTPTVTNTPTNTPVRRIQILQGPHVPGAVG
jgi:hypothetical protein